MKSRTKILTVNCGLLLILLLSGACQPIRPVAPKQPPMNLKISGELTALQDIAVGMWVSSFQVSPDSQYAVYLVSNQQDGSGGFALWSAPLSRKQSPVQLAESKNFPISFSITGDSNRVLYSILNPTNTGVALQVYSAPITGGETVQFEKLLPADQVITQFELNHKNDFVLVLTQQSDSQNLSAIYKIPVQGGKAKLITSDFPAHTIQIYHASFSQDDAWLVYTLRTREQEQEKVELYSLSTNGGQPIRLNASLIAGGSVATPPQMDFQVSSDSTYVIYHADHW